MGGVLAKIIFKSSLEKVESEAECLWDIMVEDIDGEEVLLRSVVAGKKCVLVVNVATQ
jgi:hypothetical protein